MENKRDWHLIEFFTPIKEYQEEVKEGYEPDFIIKGVAINETTTANGHKFIAEELEKASTHLIGKKLLVDHRNEVDAIKGTIKNSWWNPTEKRIEFEGIVKDKVTKEMIKDGRLSDVSIGAYAEDLVKEEDGSYIAKGLQIKELSFVAVPADSKANFTTAIQTNFAIKESMTLNEMVKCPECEKKFDSKEDMMKHKEEKHAEESLNIHTDVRRYGEMEENKLQEMESEKAKMLEEHNKLLEELNVLRNDRRNSLVSEYKKLCSDKKIKEKDVSTQSDDVIKILIEQIKDIVIEKPFKSQLAETTDLGGIDKICFEQSSLVRGAAFWEMPNSDRIRELHRNLPRFPNKYGS